MRNVGIVACAFLVLQAMNPAQTGLLPSCIFSVGDISFFIYTRENLEGTLMDKHKTVCPNTTNIAFSTHGFVSQANTTEMRRLNKALVEQLDITVYAVDWSDAACANGISLLNLLSYRSAVDNVPDIGKFVGNYIVKLMKECKVKIKDVTLIGHSLGAHVMGFASKTIQSSTGMLIPRLVGLDPAAPLFALRNCSERFCEDDGDHVMTIHTSELGIQKLIGKTDFYVNGGLTQPGCGISVSCSHSRSVTIFTESLYQDCIFVGVAWKGSHHKTMESCEANNCIVLGWNALYSGPVGPYYVTTRHTEPFCTNATVLEELLGRARLTEV